MSRRSGSPNRSRSTAASTSRPGRAPCRAPISFSACPRTGAPATDRTEVRVLYDDDNFYVGIICFDPEPSRIVIKELKRGLRHQRHRPGAAHHRQPSRSPLRVRAVDRMRRARGATPRCRKPASRTTTGTACGTSRPGGRRKAGRSSTQVPFKTLRFSKAPSQEWGLANRPPRAEAKRGNRVGTGAVPLYIASEPQYAGTLRGLENISPGRNLKLKPYVLARDARYAEHARR